MHNVQESCTSTQNSTGTPHRAKQRQCIQVIGCESLTEV